MGDGGSAGESASSSLGSSSSSPSGWDAVASGFEDDAATEVPSARAMSPFAAAAASAFFACCFVLARRFWNQT